LAYGGYAKNIRVHSHFAFLIPDNLPSAAVAPLFCAGATVFEPLRRFNVGKGHKVGIVGIGGLGHLAVQFAAALGADVTAISHSDSKKQLAKDLGAQHFLVSADEAQMTAAKNSFDYILSTDNMSASITKYLTLLKPLGGYVLLGVGEEAVTFGGGAFVVSGKSVHGSCIASPSRIEEMLKIASEKKILAHIQEFDISRVNEAIKEVREGKPRFRHVLKIQNE